MPDEDMPHIPTGNAPGFRDLRDDGDVPRAMFLPHTVNDNGTVRAVYPANSMMIGSTTVATSGEEQPSIRMDYAMAPASLLFIPTVAELRILADAFTEIADKMEKDAADMLAAALKKGPTA